MFRRSFTVDGTGFFGIGVTNSCFQIVGQQDVVVTVLKIWASGTAKWSAAGLTSAGKMSCLTMDFGFLTCFNLAETWPGVRSGMGDE